MQTFTGLSGGLLWALPRCRGLSPPFRTVLYTQRGLVKVEMEKQGFRVSHLNSHSSRFYPGDIASPVQASSCSTCKCGWLYLSLPRIVVKGKQDVSSSCLAPRGHSGMWVPSLAL